MSEPRAYSPAAAERLQRGPDETDQEKSNMPDNPEGLCRRCRFWLGVDHLKGLVPGAYGFCHRNPPSPSLADYNDDGAEPRLAEWPLTSAVDWCGEFVATNGEGR